MSADERRRMLIEAAQKVERELLGYVGDRGDSVALVKAPPGSGKTSLLLKSAAHAYALRRRVAIVTQTNSQANDICQRLKRDHPTVQAVRFASASQEPIDFGRSMRWEVNVRGLPPGPCVVVGTAAKWGITDIQAPFDIVFVEESWQLSWADFMLLARIAGRFVLIGDPGQIPPVVTTDTSRWETAPRPPHRAAPQVIWHDDSIASSKLELPGTRRLPSDSAALIKDLYDFDFASFAAPGQRRVIADKRGRTAEDRAIDLLGDGTAVGLTIPTPDAGPPMDVDTELADHAARLAATLLDRNPRYDIDGRITRLEPEHIGVVSTHRVMNAALERAISSKLKGVRVDTPERWQGLERPVMVAVHPLSGVTRPSSFDLETGRLCVMASRHKAGLIMLSRDHVGETLRDYISSADQPLGTPDVNGRGHRDNLNFWTSLESAGRLVAA